MAGLAPYQLVPTNPLIPDVLKLIRNNFAYTEGRVDPPSSVHRLTETTISRHAVTGEIWVIGRPVIACIFLTPKPDCLYVGKLAVGPQNRGAGLAHQLIGLAGQRATALGLKVLELETRVELIENQAAFSAMGFRKTGETANDGYDRPTAYTYRLQVP